MSTNSTRPVGPIVDPLPPGSLPDLRMLPGRYVDLVPLKSGIHGPWLYKAATENDPNHEIWTYLAYGPFATETEFMEWLQARETSRDPWFYAYVDKATGRALGMGAFMRADPINGAIELGNIWFSPALQKTRIATEAIFTMMKHSFDDLGVRRLEWKCDALNAPSRVAALRFGFSFEGIFRQHFIIKGRNRDTAWFAMIDKEWPAIKAGFEVWLAPDNFNSDGSQKAKLQVR